MRYCSGHLHALRDALVKRDIWKHANPSRASKFMTRWLRGIARKEELCPMSVSMLEIGAKSARMHNPLLAATLAPSGMKGDVAFALAMKHCPLCVIAKLAKDANAPATVVEHAADFALNLMVSNGRSTSSFVEPRPEVLH